MLQILVDMATPLSVFDAIEKDMLAWVKTQPEFSGALAVCASNTADPMKYTLVVWWEFSFNGALPIMAALHMQGLLPPFICFSYA